MQAPTPTMINQNDLLDHDEAEPLNGNDDDDDLNDCVELSEATNSKEMEDIMILYCQRLIIEDCTLDYGPWLVDNGVIFFEEKISSILARLCKVELRLITLNSKLQVFHTFSDDYVPNPQVNCVE
ncbi:hypothetical protein Tco_1107207 [Tanacetum coccineum]